MNTPSFKKRGANAETTRSVMQTVAENRQPAENHGELPRRLTKAREIGMVPEDPAAEALKERFVEKPPQPRPETDETKAKG